MIDRAVVSTDHEEIASAAQAAGLDAPFRRPETLSGDRIADWDVLEHALREMEAQDGVTYDIVLMLQPTSPGRTAVHVEQTLRKLVDGEFRCGLDGERNRQQGASAEAACRRAGRRPRLLRSARRRDRGSPAACTRSFIATDLHMRSRASAWSSRERSRAPAPGQSLPKATFPTSTPSLTLNGPNSCSPAKSADQALTPAVQSESGQALRHGKACRSGCGW